MTQPQTPLLDALKEEQRQLAQFEQEKVERERYEAERRKAERAQAAERARIAAEQRAKCEEAEADAIQSAEQLVNAFNRYLAAVPRPPYEVQARIANFLAYHFDQFARVEHQGMKTPDVLTYDLFDKVPYDL